MTRTRQSNTYKIAMQIKMNQLNKKIRLKICFGKNCFFFFVILVSFEVLLRACTGTFERIYLFCLFFLRICFVMIFIFSIGGCFIFVKGSVWVVFNGIWLFDEVKMLFCIEPAAYCVSSSHFPLALNQSGWKRWRELVCFGFVLSGEKKERGRGFDCVT
jgi:hypothetical protein